MGYHLHKYKLNCKTSHGHDHMILGYAGNMLGAGGLHFHFYYGISSYRDHTHYFYGITGMPIKTLNGHIHKMEGSLEKNNLHTHEFSGYTFEDISSISSTQAVGFIR